nr:glycosyltransferase-like domain-containing protein 1 [Pocillopora verrucosa]
MELSSCDGKPSDLSGNDNTENCDVHQGIVLLIEPFYGGSHKQLVDLLIKEVPGCKLYSLPAKKWHWRMRTSALYFYQNIPAACNSTYKVLFASSVLNLAELMALRPDLTQLKKVLYFHENQLIYPVRKQQERDFQYGYNQILSCLVADVVVFNSQFNMESFLSSIKSFLKLMPDNRPKELDQIIRPKCRVVHFPLMEPEMGTAEYKDAKDEELDQPVDSTVSRPLHVVWAHRWEHDKGPELFFRTLYQLAEQGLDFKVSVLGETFSEAPGIFEEACRRIHDHILHWGYQESRKVYISILKAADVAVSTAEHEFFGVSMLEAVQYGCYPLCPNKLVYPEIFPSEYLYSTPQQLSKKLRYFCRNPRHVRSHKVAVDCERFTWGKLKDSFCDLLSPVDQHVNEN